MILSRCDHALTWEYTCMVFLVSQERFGSSNVDLRHRFLKFDLILLFIIVKAFLSVAFLMGHALGINLLTF